MIRLVLAIIVAFSAVPAQAKDVSGDGARIEASMLVTGSLDIEADGSVSSHVIDQQEKVPQYVVDIIARAADRWRFEPVMIDGAPVRARARMTVRLLATPLGDGDFQVSILDATFGDRYPKGTDYVTPVRMSRPVYPGFALERKATGTAYVVLKIDRNGRVADAAIERVNLRQRGDAEVMATLRKRFSEAALAVTHRWRFAPPTTGEQVDEPFWSLRVPVVFTMGNEKHEESAYGRWISYVRGPYQRASWVPDEGNDAITGGSFQQAGMGFRLLTPLQPEAESSSPGNSPHDGARPVTLPAAAGTAAPAAGMAAASGPPAGRRTAPSGRPPSS